METERLFIITEEERNRSSALGLPVAAVTVWPALRAFPVVINVECLSRTPIFTLLFDTVFLLSYAIFLFRFLLLKLAMVLCIVFYTF